MNVSDELAHLDVGPRPGEQHGGAGLISVVAVAQGNPDIVIDRARSVLRVVLGQGHTPWPSVEQWALTLPEWFVQACAAEQTHEDMERWLAAWRNLPPEDRHHAALERRWSLSEWLHWLEPSERQWFWWDAGAEEGDKLRVVAEIRDWPAPLGSLVWLLRAAGATDVVTEGA